MPALGLAGGVLEGECEDGVALLDGVLLVRLAGVQSVIDGIEGRGGRELVCTRSSTLAELVPNAS